MAATTHRSPFIIALINSVTLESELLSSSHFHPGSAHPGQLNIYAVAQLMDKLRRREFVNALKTGRSFECSATHDGQRVAVCLYPVCGIDQEWSHLLMLRGIQGDALHA